MKTKVSSKVAHLIAKVMNTEFEVFVSPKIQPKYRNGRLLSDGSERYGMLKPKAIKINPPYGSDSRASLIIFFELPWDKKFTHVGEMKKIIFNLEKYYVTGFYFYIEPMYKYHIYVLYIYSITDKGKTKGSLERLDDIYK